MFGWRRTFALSLCALILTSAMAALIFASGPAEAAANMDEPYWTFSDDFTSTNGYTVLNDDGTILIAVNVSSVSFAVYSVADRAEIWNATGIAGWGSLCPLVISGNGDVIAFGDTSGRVRMYNAATGAVLRTYQATTEYLNEMAISDDGTKLIIGMYEQAVLLLPEGGQKTFSQSTGAYMYVDMSADGNYMIVASLHTYTLFDGELNYLDSQTLSYWFTDAQISDDGRIVAMGGYNGQLVIIDNHFGGGFNYFYPDVGDDEAEIALSGDGGTLVAISSTTLTVFDTSTVGIIWQMPIQYFYGEIWTGHDGSIFKLLDKNSGVIRTYERSSNTVVSSYSSDAAYASMANTPDGDTMAVLSDGEVALFTPQIELSLSTDRYQAASGQDFTILVHVEGARGTPIFSAMLDGYASTLDVSSLGNGDYAIELSAPVSDESGSYSGVITATCPGQVSSVKNIVIDVIGSEDDQNFAGRMDDLEQQLGSLNLMVMVTMALVVIMALVILVLMFRMRRP